MKKIFFLPVLAFLWEACFLPLPVLAQELQAPLPSLGVVEQTKPPLTSPLTVALVYYKLTARAPDFDSWVKQQDAYRNASSFDQPAVMANMVQKLKDAYNLLLLTDPLIVGARSGVLNRLRWYLELHRDASGATSTDVWDLVFKDPPPPSSATTLEALSTNATDLRNAMTARSGAITETMDYDCATFDAYGACLSLKARSTVSGDQSEGAGVLIAAYRLWPQVRAGAFIDYRLTPQGATGLTFSVERPIFGAFAGYDQEGEGRGLQGKLTAAVNTSRVSITRRSTLYDAEPGSGKASLNTYGAAGEVGWGFALEGAATATPYAGLRYTYVIRGAYGESLVPGVVDYPISYEAYSQRLLTATGGMRLKGQLSDQVGYQLGLGGEFDLTHRASPYAGSSAVPGLESFALPFAAASNHFHALGSAGLVYQIDRTQRLTGDVYLRSQAFSSQTAAAVVVGYQAAF